MSYFIVIAFVDNKNNDLCKNKPQSQFMVGFEVFKIQKAMQKQLSYLKREWPLKAWVKSCEVKSGSHEMAAVMLMMINFNNVQSRY